MEKAQGLVIRTSDFSESSRIATLWTREHGKVRALAKGGRRLKSNFDSALDLLNVCSIVLLRKSSGALDLLTEAQVRERFPQLRHELSALYGSYYLAELLCDGSQDFDPHPELYDEVLDTLRTLGQAGVMTGPRLARFELVLLREFGYGPALTHCAICSAELVEGELAFSAAGGGVLCRGCQATAKDRRPLSNPAWTALRSLQTDATYWPRFVDPELRRDVRQVLNDYVSYWLGRRPRLLPFLGS